MIFLSWLIVGYLSGSIPFAAIIAKARGVDIFKAGSGNPGATNVMRSVGPWAGRLCFLFDALKGFVPVILPLSITCTPSALPLSHVFAAVALIGAILGHSFSPWIKFRGGKGVATTIGGLFALAPPVMFVGVVIWIAVFYLSRYVSLSSIIMALWLPLGAWIFKADQVSFTVVTIIAFLIIARHKDNIVRLMKGTENRFGKK
jgi:glycerol-3-phosphate acyltransferase PlsY